MFSIKHRIIGFQFFMQIQIKNKILKKIIDAERIEKDEWEKDRDKGDEFERERDRETILTFFIEVTSHILQG